MQDFVDRLDERRLALGLNHQQFARYIGVNEATWSLVRRGHNRPGAAFVGRVLQSRPELVKLLTNYKAA